MVDFGLAENLSVREDTPLVLGIDVVPPGLERPVTLSAVGVGEDPTDQLKDDLVLLFASRDRDGETEYQSIELTNTGALVEWPDGFFDQGSDEAHQLLIASAAKQRQGS